MREMTDKTVRHLYYCYLGKTVTYRSMSIVFFVKNNGPGFFRKYSLAKDSVSRFIDKLYDKGLL